MRQQFLSSYEFRDIHEANEKVLSWCLDEYGMQVHGTTRRKPFEVFKTEEQPNLKSLSEEKFDIPLWKEAKVHPDHHIVFDKSYYSVPTRYVGKKMWVKGGMHTVQIFCDGELIKTHQRSYTAGTWRTDEKDYPPEKSRYLLRRLSYYQTEALKYGHYVCQMVTRIMTEHAYRNLRKVQAVFRLADKYGHEAVNLTCKRCLFYEDHRMSTIKRILDKGLYYLPLEEESIKLIGGRSAFIRAPEYFVHTKEE